MPGRITVHELVRIALKVEEQGYEFYYEMSRRPFSDESKRLLAFFADQERHHGELYAALLESLAGKDLEVSGAGDPDKYIQALAREGIFNQQTKAELLADPSVKEEDVFRFAHNIEETTVRFYEVLSAALPSRERAVVRRIIQEEVAHSHAIQKMVDY